MKVNSEMDKLKKYIDQLETNLTNEREDRQRVLNDYKMQLSALNDRLAASEVRAKEFESSSIRQSQETLKYLEESKMFEKSLISVRL